MELRGYQHEAKASVYRYFEEKQGHPLLVLPTAAGKSVLHGAFCGEVLTAWPGQRILSLTHVKELIEQNSKVMSMMWPHLDVGIYSASLRKRDRFQNMIFAGIQSVHNKSDQLGAFDLITVDEAHLVPHKDDTMYRRFLDEQFGLNDKLKIIGLSATPFRLDSGFLHTGEDALFTDICYNLPITRLINEGYLVPLISKAGVERMDTSAMRTVRGDFKTGDMVDEAKRIMAGACEEIFAYGQDRDAWLIFCPGVEYAEEVAAHMRDVYKVRAECLHGKTPRDERERIIEQFKAGQIKCLTNCDILTTGFDAPVCDMIAFLRPTKSASLYIQMCGRGMRLNEEAGKTDCLVLDFAGNVSLHGPVDTINIVDKIGGKKGEVELEGATPTKDCPECNAIVSVQTRICPFCHYVWPPKHDITANTQAIISTLARPEILKVDEISYRAHTKPGKPDSMRVTYRCGMRFVDEWICPDHDGFAKRNSIKWLVGRGMDRLAAELATVETCLNDHKFFRRPTTIEVRQDGKFDRIVSYGYEPVIEKPVGPDWGDDTIPFDQEITL